MSRLRIYVNKVLGKDREKNYNDYVEYNPQNIEKVLKKFDELTSYINSLEKSLKAAENKTNTYEDMLHKYEKMFKEEIALYRLHKSNVSVLNQTFNENELLIHEIQQQIRAFVDTEYVEENDDRKITFKRILSRFFHQNELHKFRVQQRLCELDETIEKKNRMLERMQGEIKTCYHQSDSSFSSPQPMSLQQACG